MDCNLSLSDFCNNFYSSTGQENGAGQIVYCPVTFQDRRPLIADIARADGLEHKKADITIRKYQEAVDFKGKDRLPVAALENLEEKSEAIISIGKVRPCLIIGSAGEVDPNLLPTGWQRNKALNAFDTQYLLAPIYSASTHKQLNSFGPILTARIRAAMYTEFLFLPKSEPALPNDSICRLDRMFLSPLLCAARHRDLWLHEEAMSFLNEQLFWMLGQEPEQEFLDTRQLLLDDLPDEAK
tara:strand:+ start:1818 stop:2537 length:720 start_codon:yes stop_codon:yes gene_type:complete